jgi:hypothetical protein
MRQWGAAMPRDLTDFHFLLTGCNDEQADGEIDLDGFQLVFLPHYQQIRINLTREQVAQLQKWPSAMSRRGEA